MFKDLICIKAAHDASNLYIYELQDTQFTCRLWLSGGASLAQDFVILFKEYQQRTPFVISNMARFYLWLQKKYNPISRSWLEEDRNYLDKSLPELKYGEKYYPCLLRQFKQLNFARQVIKL